MNIGSMTRSKVNKAKVLLQIRITNDGSKVIEDYKLRLEIIRGKAEIETSDREGGIFLPHIDFDIERDLSEDKLGIEFVPKKKTSIVQKDHRILEAYIYIPAKEEGSIRLKWHLLSRDFNISGRLGVISKPSIFKYKSDTAPLSGNRIFSDRIINDD